VVLALLLLVAVVSILLIAVGGGSGIERLGASGGISPVERVRSAPGRKDAGCVDGGAIDAPEDTAAGMASAAARHGCDLVRRS
jgi:hypothetical protein